MPAPPATSPETPAQPRSRWWKWPWRVVKWLLMFILVLAIFHRPIVKWTVGYLAKRAATNAGLSSEWTLGGTVTGDLNIQGLTITGGEGKAVQNIEANQAEVKYNLWELIKGNIGGVVQEVTVDQLTLELDLTNPPPKPDPAMKKPKGGPIELPEIHFPKISITNCNVRIKQPNGILLIENFTLLIDPSTPGRIEWERCVIPGLSRTLTKVNGTTALTNGVLQFSNLQVTPETLIEQLSVGLTELSTQTTAVELKASQGVATLDFKGIASNWSPDIALDATTLSASGLSQADLTYWGLPITGLDWHAPQLHLEASGPVLRPDLLKWNLALENADVSIRDTKVEGIHLVASAEAGEFNIMSLKAALGRNRADLSGQVALPQRWAEVGRATGRADVAVDAAQLDQLVPQLQGNATAKGSVAFSNLKLDQADLTLNAKALEFSGIPVETAFAEVSMVNTRVTLKKADVALNAQNRISMSGMIDLKGDRPWQAKWQADCADLSTVPAAVRGNRLWPEAGSVSSTGAATGSVAAIESRNWAMLEGDANVIVSGLKVKGASLDHLKLDVSSANGVARLKEFTVALDAANGLSATGELTLNSSEFPFTSKLQLSLPKLRKASLWGEAFGAPRIENGEANVSWNASGAVTPFMLRGDGVADVKSVKLAGIPEELGLRAVMEQMNTGVRLSTLKATAGPWLVDGRMDWDGAFFTIPQLAGSVNGTPLVNLTAKLPLDYKKEPMALALKVDQLDATKLATALGQKWPVSGVVSADATFDGALQALTGQLNVDLRNVKTNRAEIAKLAPGALTLKATLESGKLTAATTLTQAPLRPLQLNAVMPLPLVELMEDSQRWKTLPVEGSLQLPSSSLSFLPKFIPVLYSATGNVSIDAKATGMLEDLHFSGGLTLDMSEVSFNQSNLPTVKDVTIRLKANEHRLSIEQANLMLAGGLLKGSGFIGLKNLKDPDLQIKLDASQVLVIRDETMSFRADANLVCEGSLKQASVKGSVDLVRGRVFKEIEYLPLSLPDQLPPPPASSRLGKSGPPSLPPPFDQWDFAVTIKTKDPIRLMGNIARGSAVADLRLDGKGAAPELTGNVSLENTWVKLPFSRLNVRSGIVSFSKEQPFDPQIQLTGESIVGNYMVTVNVTGRAMDPKVRFSSNPPLPEGDIASLLATGTTTSDLQSGDGEAAGRAIYLLVKSTYRKLFPKLNDDDFNESEPPRLSFELSGFGSDPKKRGVAAVYELNPKWKVIGRVGEVGTFRGMLYYLIRFR